MVAPELANDQSGGAFDSQYWEVVTVGVDPTPIEDLDPLSRRVNGVLELIDEIVPPDEGGDAPPAVPTSPHIKQGIGKMTLMGLKDGDAYGRPRSTRRMML